MKGERLPKRGISGEYEASVVTSGRFSKRGTGSCIFAMCGQDGRYAIVCTKAYANDIAERMRIDVHTQRVGKCFIAASWISLHGRGSGVSIGRGLSHTRHAARTLAPKRATIVNKCEHAREVWNSACISIRSYIIERLSFYNPSTCKSDPLFQLI